MKADYLAASMAAKTAASKAGPMVPLLADSKVVLKAASKAAMKADYLAASMAASTAASKADY